MNDSRRNAFTLIEVLVGLTVLGLLASLVAVSVSGAKTSVNRAKCASNMRQIGIGLLAYAVSNKGYLPKTRHSTERGENWIYTLKPYIGDVREIRICPADEPERQQRIRDLDTTSYLLNDLVLDPDLLDPSAPRYDNVAWIPRPAQTLLAVISNREPSASWDHAHCGDWTGWYAALNDVAVDRHRNGGRSPSRMNGSANYLYADGRVENHTAAEWKALFDRGINPGAVPAD